jgi:hypothetical protein
VAKDATEASMKIHGNLGYATEFPLQQRFRDVMAYLVADAAAEIQKMVIAREIPTDRSGESRKLPERAGCDSPASAHVGQGGAVRIGAASGQRELQDPASVRGDTGPSSG